MSNDTAPSQSRVAAYVLTLNEDAHVAATVASLRGVTERILVLDSNSSDGTAETARYAGAHVETHAFESFEKQRNFAVARVVELFNPAWILTIDADERLGRGLAEEIQSRVINSADEDLPDGYMVRLQVRFEGRLMHHGGLARSRLLRLFRPTAGRYESRSVNEHFAMYPGKRLGLLRSPIEHEDVSCWERHIAKHNRYSTLEARERMAASLNHSESVTAAAAFRMPYLRRRWLRERIWNRLPAKPALRFVQMYLFSAGFLDGRAGFDIALFQAWQELCTERKFSEMVEGGVTNRQVGSASAQQDC